MLIFSGIILHHGLGGGCHLGIVSGPLLMVFLRSSQGQHLHIQWDDTIDQTIASAWVNLAPFIVEEEPSTSVSDPDSFFTDPDPGFFSNPDPGKKNSTAKSKYWEKFLFPTQKVGILFLLSTNQFGIIFKNK